MPVVKYCSKASLKASRKEQFFDRRQKEFSAQMTIAKRVEQQRKRRMDAGGGKKERKKTDRQGFPEKVADCARYVRMHKRK
jgi:hypothetical protein